jgi:tetratricopeptide (TPR) repeat protein
MEEHRDSASQARALFRLFLAERWFGGPDFDSWVKKHAEFASELVRLRDEWFAELAEADSPGALKAAQQGLRSTAFEPGKIVGGFRLRERIGRGAMGEVWAAEELALGGRMVALKLLRPDLAPDPRAMERFRREALAGARIRHPGVVAVYSVGRVLGQPYIAQELVEGGQTLATLIAQARLQGKPGGEHFRRAARLVAQVADALQAVHDHDIVHRDVKPQNILVAPDDVVKVADLGLAHLAGENVLSLTGDVMGTFCYMSPAQAQGEVKDLDGRADVFSLGATLYELLTLQRAFAGDTPPEILRKILHEDPPSSRTLHLHLPRDLELITHKALEKRAADRYASMAELAEDLRRFLRGEPIQAKAASFRGRVRKWARRHPTWSVGLCLTGLALPSLAWMAGVNARERDQRRQAQHERFLLNAQWMSEVGHMERAATLVEAALALDASDPTGHLILAAGYARLGRIPERNVELGRARQLGFGESAEGLDSALEHGAYGLYLMSQLDPDDYAEAEQHLRLALELDPEHHGFLFSLYQMHIANGRVDEAVAALVTFRDRLPPVEPLFQVVDALLLEHRGELRAALDTLEHLAAQPGMSEEELSQLRWNRQAGRLCLRLAELERAEQFLRRAVEEAPTDYVSWDNLAVLYIERAMQGDHGEETRTAARECADRALRGIPSLPNPFRVRAWLAVWELCHAPVGADPRENPAWQEARASLDRLAELDPANTAPELEADLRLLEAWHAGVSAYSAKDFELARERFEALLEVAPENLRSVALLGQCLFHVGRYVEGLTTLERALALWEDPNREEETEDYWLGAILAWTLGNADKAGDAPAFAQARARLAKELDRGARFQKEELLVSAEFLATASPELQDCELAWQLVIDHALESAFEGGAGREEARGALRRIEEACP